MPRPILIALAIEIFLLVIALLGLTQPAWLRGRSFERNSEKGSLWKSFLNGVGFVFLSLLFCWSVILGILMVLNGVSVRV